MRRRRGTARSGAVVLCVVMSLTGAVASHAGGVGAGPGQALLDRRLSDDPAALGRPLEAAQVRGTGPDATSLDDALRALLCVEAREIVGRGELPRWWARWVLMNAHRCADEALLFDALGF